MSETLSEFQGCDVLARLFRARGYAIKRNQLFREYGVEFHVDGWDARARVGFEFLTSEDDDHDDLTLEEYKTLADAQRRGELSLFIIDEVEPVSEKDLVAEAHEFLDEVAAAAQARLKRAAVSKARGRVAAKAKTARAAKKAAKKAKRATKKPIAGKPAKKKAKPAKKPRSRGRG
ncbi:MAG: hypothetical protein EBR28_02345 [Planctomycetia bacterium]|nr:hypothetical protein [Planctomycetia bacterium]